MQFIIVWDCLIKSRRRAPDKVFKSLFTDLFDVQIIIWFKYKEKAEGTKQDKTGKCTD